MRITYNYKSINESIDGLGVDSKYSYWGEFTSSLTVGLYYFGNNKINITFDEGDIYLRSMGSVYSFKEKK